ncbi:fimbrial protein [Burkholderia orbicola]|uniref:fimbrial protein n=1 Tax=Burkholderia cepacia complex TaxID=87882 RepID=UPI00158C9E9F|nr:fimbrial protein [Burkholderia cenocepacia]MDR5665725.1 type 1 fimbrial protein [Burkholderia cenocepacia]MDR5668738.1 type 1 fimbrial protein [Burkholderia cenocepacia]MDR8096576.1 type 1 fimbrial protein [Burkholderia cenocepacia]
MKLILFVVAVLAGVSTSASAVTCEADTSDGLSYYVAKLSGFNPPSFDPTAVPIGGVIYSTTGSPVFSNKGAALATYKCNESVYTAHVGIGAPVNYIYPTSIPNIGIRMKYGNTYVPYTSSFSYREAIWNEQFKLTIELVKTGEITAGGVLSGAYFQYRANNAAGQLLVEYRFASPILIQPRVPTCKVATPQISVPMGSMSLAMFKGVGATTFASAFDISLTCSGGSNGTSTKAFITLSDVTAPGNTSTTLSLTKDSTATGVGIQVLKDNVLLGFGPDSAAVGNMNQWYAGTVAQGQAQLRIPLSARYVQIAEKVTPGSANARATFTMSYQ